MEVVVHGASLVTLDHFLGRVRSTNFIGPNRLWFDASLKNNAFDGRAFHKNWVFVARIVSFW